MPAFFGTKLACTSHSLRCRLWGGAWHCSLSGTTPTRQQGPITTQHACIQCTQPGQFVSRKRCCREGRQKHGLLEKKKDYKQRAQDFNKKRKAIKVRPAAQATHIAATCVSCGCSHSADRLVDGNN